MTKSEEAHFMADDKENIKSAKYEEYISIPSSPTPDKDKESTTPKTRHRRWILIGLSYSNFWTAACISLQAPFFPKEAEAKGATPTQYGFIFGVFELVVVVMSPFYAKMMPRIKPKFFAVGGVLLEGIACTAFGLLDVLPAGNIYIGMAFAIRILEGFAASAITTASFTIIAGEFSDSVATSFSAMETAFGFGLIIGPTIGGVLYQAGGFPLPFAVCGVCLLSAGGFLIFGLSSVKVNREPEPPRDWKAFFFNFDIMMYVFAIVTSLFYIGFNSATLEPHLRMFDLKPSILGLIFVVNGALYAFTTPLWGRILDKGVDPFLICAIGYVLVCISLLFIGPIPFIPLQTTLWLVIVSLIICGLGMAAKLVAAFVGTLKSTRERGLPDNVATFSMVSALFSSSCSAGAFVGPTIGGFLLDTVGYENGTFLVFGAELLFFAALLIHIGVRRYKNKTKNPERSPLLGPKTADGVTHISNG